MAKPKVRLESIYLRIFNLIILDEVLSVVFLCDRLLEGFSCSCAVVRDLVCSASVTRLKSFAQLQFLPVATPRLTGSLNIVLKNLVFRKCYCSFKILTS